MDFDVADQRLVRGVAGTLSWQATDAEGEARDPGTVTVGVTRADGTVLVASGTATSGTGDEPRTYTLTPADTAQLDTLTVTWTAGAASFTTVVEIAGAHLFTTAELRDEVRAPDGGGPSDMAKYPADVVARARLRTEAECEWICDVAFVPRYQRLTVPAEGDAVLHLPVHEIRTVRSLSVDGVAWSSGELEELVVDDRTISRPTGIWRLGQRVTIGVEHGLRRPPEDLRQAAMQRCWEFLFSPFSAVPARTTRFRVPETGATFELGQANAYTTGNADIDAAYERHSRRAKPGADGASPHAPASRTVQFDPAYRSVFHGGIR